ncbi:hypothetical protein JTE90_029574 [Oedothorax gibbosus]|uniref:28S ribosomal protein S30, mitochondrial n=1 Tax=Oedothorax gibbosus TaxID=931172 RepID=A0AAV6VAX3_9ARAC|nr:hypothetical protein JTE90_029574 [Oedothorax gibbosus]
MLSQMFSNLSASRIISRPNLKNISRIAASRLQHQLAEIKNEAPNYPPIIDPSDEGQKRHQRQLWYDSIKAMPTAEEKLYELSVQQRVRSTKHVIKDVPNIYTGIHFQNFITRTHLEKDLPDKLKMINVDTELSEIRDVLNEVLYNYYCNAFKHRSPKQLSDFLSEEEPGSSLAKSLIAQCSKKLAVRNEYIMNSTIQHQPRIDSFWWHAGYPSETEDVYEQNLCFQYKDFASFVVRMKEPLSPILNLDHPLCATSEVPDYKYQPEVFDYDTTIRHISSVPGIWPGDEHQFPLILFNTTDKLKDLLSQIKYCDISKIEHSLGVTSSFGYLNAIATYQGFTPFHDLTYPLVAQSVLTNGQDWTFFVYQLNTIAFHSDVDQKDRRNICWSSKKMRLFDTIEDGQVKGINEEVYKVLLKFLLNAPIAKDGLNLRPYLGEDKREKEDAEHMRYFLRKMFSWAPEFDEHLLEVPTWEQIYKDHPEAPPSPYIKRSNASWF